MKGLNANHVVNQKAKRVRPNCFACYLQLLGRMGTLEESGQACLYLAAEATFTTGIDLLLSGGAELTYGKKTQVESA